jgi:ribosomal protein L17
MVTDVEGYDHYLALDWSMKTMAIARLTPRHTEPKVLEQRSDLKELKAYLLALRGRKILAIEETTSTHWLYVELHDVVDRIVVCDPYRNHLLSDGPKTDRIDATKLCLLLKAGLLKEVFHTLEQNYMLRKVVSGYTDVIKAGVRLLNQRSAFDRAEGNQQPVPPAGSKGHLDFVRDHVDTGIAWYTETKAAYETHFQVLAKQDARIRHQASIPGIGIKGAVKIVAKVLDPHRFTDRGPYWAYCGLVKHQKESGGRSYGQRLGRYDRMLKSVYKTAANAVLNSDNPLHDYYEALLAKGVAAYNARNALARKIAAISLALLKHNTSYHVPTSDKEPTTTS